MIAEEKYLPGRRLAPEKLGDVCVLGLGKSTQAVVDYCVSLLGTRVSRLFVAGGALTANSQAYAESFDDARIVFEFGDDAVEKLASLTETGRFDLCIPSPGIPFYEKLYVQGSACSDAFMSEVEFAWRESAADSVWVAITGTNGKTTTTSVAASLLAHAGYAASAVGNIGDVCLTAVAEGSTQVYVAEVSSYQLASTKLFAPDVAILLNITPDHVHWHRTLEAYRDAKLKLIDNVAAFAKARALSEPASAPAPCSSEAPAELANLQADSLKQSSVPLRSRGVAASEDSESARAFAKAPVIPVAILDATNDVVRAKVRELKAIPDAERGFAYIPLGTADGIEGDMRAKCGATNAAYLDSDGMLHVAYNGTEHVLCAAKDLKITGHHNIGNALAAACAALALGVSDACIAEGLVAFEPLEHRIEPCGTVRGIACYNDSKATNTDATVQALASFPETRVVVLLGGDDKGTDLGDLAISVCAHAHAAICFGAGGQRFFEALSDLDETTRGDVVLLQARLMEDAFDVALGIADPGDVILLSPACASFDEFANFEERGRAFKQLVALRREEQGA